MTATEVESMLRGRLGLNGVFSPAAIVEYQGTRGLAFMVGENISSSWQSGDIGVLWSEGELTVLPDEVDVLQEDAWAV